MEKNAYIGGIYKSKEGWTLLVNKKNVNGNWNVTPFDPRGKKKSSFALLPQDITWNDIHVGGNTYYRQVENKAV